MLSMDLPRTLREFRSEKRWSAVELARRAGISRTALKQLESGATNKPHAETLKRIALALGVPIEALLGTRPIRTAPSARPPAAAAARPMVLLESATRLSSARVEKLVEMFTLLLSSPLAEALGRIVEESSRLLPIIQPGSTSGGPQRAPGRNSPASG
jgi:transcriptional regulator with XRE-family HTH domain